MNTKVICIIIVAILLFYVLYIGVFNKENPEEIVYDTELGGTFQIANSVVKEGKNNVEIKFNIASDTSDIVNVISNKISASDANKTLREKKINNLGNVVIELSFLDTKFQDRDRVDFYKQESVDILDKIISYTPRDNKTSLIFLVCTEDTNIEIVRNKKVVTVKLSR